MKLNRKQLRKMILKEIAELELGTGEYSQDE